MGCGREIRCGEPFRYVRRMERKQRIGDSDAEILVGVGEPYSFHRGCVPYGDPMWRPLQH